MYLTLAEHKVPDRFIPCKYLRKFATKTKCNATRRLPVRRAIIKDALALAMTSASKELQGQINAKSKLLFISPSCGERLCKFIYLTITNYRKI